MNDNENKKGFFLKRKVKQLNSFADKLMAKNDPALSPVATGELVATKEERVLCRGGVDLVFLLLVIALSAFGAVMAYSASSVSAELELGDSLYYFVRHIAFLALGFGFTSLFIIFARPWFWRMFGLAAYVISIILLVIVLLMGTIGGGAQRWIDLGIITIQPSEIAKMATIMFLALILTKYDSRLDIHQKFNGHFKYGILYPGMAIALVCGLVMLEKHLSGIIIIGLLGLIVMFIGGSDKRWMAAIIGVGVIVVLIVLLVSDYAQTRVETWLNIKDADPLGSAWQTLQGLYAIGSGGFFGVGLGNSRQKYGYVSEPQNDFIFSIICEELGFVGAAAVIILFALLLWRGYEIASKAPDKFCSLVVYGLTTKVALQVILNIAVVTNSMPNTGISLPFFSSGGTALVMQIFEMGIILSISRFSYVKK